MNTDDGTATPKIAVPQDVTAVRCEPGDRLIFLFDQDTDPDTAQAFATQFRTAMNDNRRFIAAGCTGVIVVADGWEPDAVDSRPGARTRAVDESPGDEPFQPDPEIVGNAEGNERLRAEDRRAAEGGG